MTEPDTAEALSSSAPPPGQIAYGCWRLTQGGVEAARRNINAALEAGMTVIDTADIYGYGEPAGFGGAEALLGQILSDAPHLRAQMYLATKAGVDLPKPYNSSPAYLEAALNASLARLATDYVDLFYIHRPDLTVPFSDVAGALNRFMASGRIRAVGVSNFTASQARALAAHLDAPIAAIQCELSAWHQAPLEDGTLDLAMEIGAKVYAWSPLAGGSLATGSPLGAAAPADFERLMVAIDRLAEARGASRTQIALAFVTHLHARPVPIIGTQSPGRITEAASAAEITLKPEEVYGLVAARRGAPLP
ncbi:MAG: aldo/keto reductase [Pseudomonadota bacterium]